jgi:hypothetical protein
MSGKLIVYTTPAEGREDEYNDWYDNVHLAEVLALGPFVQATRHRISESQVFPVNHTYVAIYDFEGPADAALAALVEGAAPMDLSDAMTDPYMVVAEDR